jgi:hypothetical protein
MTKTLQGFVKNSKRNSTVKSTAHIKKHIKNAKQLESLRKRQTIIHLIQGWILPEEELPLEIIEKLVGIMEQLIADFEWDDDFEGLLITAVLYGTKVVKTHGRIPSDQVPNHLAVSICLATKYLEDQSIGILFLFISTMIILLPKPNHEMLTF